jgi:hypothetical protein
MEEGIRRIKNSMKVEDEGVHHKKYDVRCMKQ